MWFYKILPASASYKGKQPLAYRSESKLIPGQLVTIPLRRQVCAGVIVGTAKNPGIETKVIIDISQLPPLPKRLVSLSQWMIDYYNCAAGSVARQLISKNYLSTMKPIDGHTPRRIEPNPPQLTNEQKNCLSKISSRGTYLLHGETGSGKTRVYIELTKKTLSTGRSAIILTPEIGLTTQLAGQFQAVFGDKVLVIHSRLTLTERRQAWQKMLTSHKPLVIIGPRSALFSPLENVGLIVIDESHDNSYKQSDAPRYNAGTVASKLAEICECTLVLGSATPSINDYFLAEFRQRPILKMTRPAIETSPDSPKLSLIDIKDRANFKHSQHLSDRLIAASETALKNGEQVLLFLNRRGTASVVICTNCGWQATCPNCGIPLTYHGDTHSLRCHSCSHHEVPIACCKICGNNLTFRGVGTKAVEAEANKIFPGAKIRRFDNDNLKNERLEKIYESVKSGEVNIIIGTQTIAKGLDLPKLSVVGVIVADTGLYLPDYSADERTYQLIRQVVGRVGRGHRPGSAFIQTYSPNSFVVKAAVNGDYDNFYKHELSVRQKFHFPPSVHLLKLTVNRATTARAQTAAKKLKHFLEKSDSKLVIEGPSPSFHEARNGRYYWQLIVKSTTRANLLAAMDSLPPTVTTEIDPISLL